jgi:tRNA (uracil-5-)-methyltransferase/23S rRNA (uracil1939-C5)-methyltransferase
MASPLEWAYRNNAQYLVTSRGLAYRERGSHTPAIVRNDPLVTELIADGLGSLDPAELEPSSEIAFRASVESGEVHACLIGLGKPRDYYAAREHLRDLGVNGVSFAFASLEGRFYSGVHHLWGKKLLLERYGDITLSVNAHGFAQVNPLAAGELYRHAATLAGTGADALDLYGGSGGLAFHLKPHFAAVTVLEISPESIARGQADAARLGLPVHFVRGDATNLRDLPADVISLDPPRAGLSAEALEAVGQSVAQRLVYVSCDPATWARDVARLTRYGFALQQVQPWDFYPQTHHVEVLSLLER